MGVSEIIMASFPQKRKNIRYNITYRNTPRIITYRDSWYMGSNENSAPKNTRKPSGRTEQTSATIRTMAKLSSLPMYPSLTFMVLITINAIRNFITGIINTAYLAYNFLILSLISSKPVIMIYFPL